MLRRKRFWLALALTVVFLGFFLARTDFDEIWQAFREADAWLALAAVPLYFVGFWFRTMRWSFLLRPVCNVPVPRLYPVVLIGLMTNNVAPARVGELVRAYLVGERESMSKSTALGTIAVDRAFDGLTLVAILGIVAATSGVSAGVRSVGILAALAFALAATVLTVLAFSPTRGRSLLLRLIALLPQSLSTQAIGLLDAFISGLAAIRTPSAMLKAGLASVASWLTECAMYYIVGEAFHLPVGFHVYLLILAGANLALSIFQTPGGVGPFEATTQQILIHFLGGEAAGQASAYALALHALLLGPVILVGFLLVWLTQVSLRDILGVSRAPIAPTTQALE